VRTDKRNTALDEEGERGGEGERRPVHPFIDEVLLV